MRIKFLVIVSALLSMYSADLLAAEELEEIIVTATRREVNVQDTGISVSAFSGDTLDQLNITDTDLLTTVTPGLMFQNGGGTPLVGLVSIRGVAQNDFAGHIESPNALYVDEVYQSSISTNSIKMYDMNRVEVLRGPQGTLFGRNATGGLIHLITNKPTDNPEGYLKVSGGGYDSYVIEGALSGPVSDNFKARLAVFRSKANGWIDNALGPDQIPDDTKAARLHLDLTPTDKLEILLSGDIYKMDLKNVGAAYSQAAAVDPVTGLGYNVGTSSNLITGYVDADGNKYTGAFDQFGYLYRNSYNLTARISYDFDAVKLISLSNFNHVKVRYLEDNDLSPFPFIEFGQTGNSDTVSQELRLVEDQGSTRWTAGVYYLNIDGTYSQDLNVLPPPAYDANVLSLGQKAIWSVDTTSYSMFGQFEFDLSKQLMLTAGARWTYDKKDYSYIAIPRFAVGGVSIPGVAPLGVPPGSLVEASLANNGVSDSHHEDGISARLQLDYSVNDDWLLYASFNKGYKAFNYNAGFAGHAPFSGVRFHGEDIYAYEAGSKLDFWSGKARWNISAYYYDYKDYQAFDQRGINFTLFNTDATIKGLDSELQLKPADDTTLLIGIALLDTTVKDVLIGTDPANPISVDRDAPQSPSFTFSGTIVQDFHLGAGLLSIQFSGYYNSGYYSQLTNAPNTDIPDYTVYNGRISYTNGNGKFEVALFAKNLFDKKYYTYAFDIAANGFTEQSLAPPRWVGVEVRYDFF